MQGEPTFFQISIRNPFSGTERFSIKMKDESEDKFAFKEVIMITDIKEMQHWDSEGLFNFVNQKNRQ